MPVSPIERDEVVGRIADLRADLKDDIAELKGIVNAGFGQMNTRVSAIELWKARGEGFRAAYNWVPTLVSSLLCGVGATVITLILAH